MASSAAVPSGRGPPAAPPGRGYDEPRRAPEPRYEEPRRYDDRSYKRKRRGSFLEELFDFD